MESQLALFYQALSLFYLSTTAKQTKGSELRVGDSQPKDLRKIALGLIGVGLLMLVVVLLGWSFNKLQ